MLEITKNGSLLSKKLLNRSQLDYETINARVYEIVQNVHKNGDKALFDYTKRFDNVDLNENNIRFQENEIDQAFDSIDKELLYALRRAKNNILEFQKKAVDLLMGASFVEGDKTGFCIRAVENAGLYVPGGKAAYPSSVLMTACAAKAANVSRMIMVTPVGGGINPLVLVAARECGVDEIYRIGGAQAVAALAYGTQSVPKCDVIAGPGNIYVTLAKKMIYGQAGIDMLAGPSEILIIADNAANPSYIAADLLSQAEHDEMASCILLTTSESLAREVNVQLEKQLKELPKASIASKALAEHSGIILVNDLDEAAGISNIVAPEHLELCVNTPFELLKKIKNAGAVFVGNYSPEPVGDYYAGPNHVLPTGGAARFSSALSAECFLKKISIINYSNEDLKAAAEDIILLSKTESLHAHANSIKIRQRNF